MLHSIFLLFFIVFVVYFTKRWKVLSREQRTDLVKQFVIWGSVGFLLAMIAMGRASWIMGVIAALIAILSRASQLLVFFPMLKKIFSNKVKEEKASTVNPLEMTREQAAEILGVDVNASHDEIRLAHKRLMQKIHPDRGGTEALAKQINQAKERLMS